MYCGAYFQKFYSVYIICIYGFDGGIHLRQSAFLCRYTLYSSLYILFHHDLINYLRRFPFPCDALLGVKTSLIIKKIKETFIKIGTVALITRLTFSKFYTHFECFFYIYKMNGLSTEEQYKKVKVINYQKLIN